MEVIIPDEIRQCPRLHVSSDMATSLLKSEAPPSGHDVRAEWGVYRDEQGRSGLELAISDSKNTASMRIPYDKLLDKDYLWGRAIRIWGDFLQERSHRQRARVEELLQVLGEE